MMFVRHPAKATRKAFAAIALALIPQLLLLVAASPARLNAQTLNVPSANPLWPNGAPGAKGQEEADVPTVRHYAPEKPGSGAAVIICPGGGYRILAYDHEGHQVGKFVAQQGVAAFVLRYRHAPKYHHPTPMHDVQRAIRYVRHNAKRLRVDPQRIGVMGFSAGGHLASTAATHFDGGDPDSEDPVDRVGCRPDFAVLCYPVISMTEPWGHRGSRENLLGDRAGDESLAKSLSNDLQVTAETPRTFLFHTAKDTSVPVRNSLAFFAALQDKGVPAEIHVYQHGPHGVGMANGDPAVSTWTKLLMQWMRTANLLTPVKRVPVAGMVTLNGEPLNFGAITFQGAGKDGKWRASAWAMVRRGKFSIPADVGPSAGKCTVQIVDWGDVVAEPTREDARTITAGSLTVELSDANENQLAFDLE